MPGRYGTALGEACAEALGARAAWAGLYSNAKRDAEALGMMQRVMEAGRVRAVPRRRARVVYVDHPPHHTHTHTHTMCVAGISFVLFITFTLLRLI